MVYFMLTGDYPFRSGDEDNKQDVLDQINRFGKGDNEFMNVFNVKLSLKKVSDEGKDFVKKCLNNNP